MKKIISVLMCLILTISLSTTAFAAVSNNDSLEEDIDAAIALANSQPIVADKVVITRGTTGTYPTRKGVILSTPTNDSLGEKTFVGHSAIVYNKSTVIESLSNGVTTGKNNWYLSKTTCYGVTVYGTSPAQDAAAADYCYRKIGCPYNYNFLDVETRTKFYCSQLIWASYLDLYGIDLNTSTLGKIITPMELVNTDKTYIVYSKTTD